MSQDIQLRLPNRTAFLKLFFHEGQIGSIFVPGATEARPGDQVRLGVFFEEEQRTFRVRGSVRWKRLTKSKRLPVGMAVEVDRADSDALNLILEFANGREVSYTQRNPRVPAQIQIHYATGSVFLTDVTEDVSNGGVFLRTQEPLEVGDTLRLKLKLPGDFFSVRVGGEVAWVRQEPPGAGIRFTFESDKAQSRVERIVQELRKQIAEDFEIHDGTAS
ncbi:MAG: TIGR02266 family protein [Myxococcota bacterium]